MQSLVIPQRSEPSRADKVMRPASVVLGVVGLLTASILVPDADGKTIRVRLFNPSEDATRAELRPGKLKWSSAHCIDPETRKERAAPDVILLPPWGIATLRLVLR